jgi:hypothetical protein
MKLHRISNPVNQILSDCQAQLQEWIRQEIVDDDPCDEKTLFPESSSAKTKPTPPKPKRR